MTNFAERIARTYPDPDRILPATKADALELLEDLRTRIGELDDFAAFPEGAPGIVLHALLADGALGCADAGGLTRLYESYLAVLDASSDEVRDSTKWL